MHNHFGERMFMHMAGKFGGRGGRSEVRDEFRAVRHRLRAALGDFVDAPADKQAEAIAILEAAAEALEALSRG